MRARDNPFSVERIERLAFRLPADLSWESLLDRLVAMDYRAAIVGNHGSGKTTFLRHLRDRLTAGGRHVHELFLNQDSPRADHRHAIATAAQSRPDSILLLDGADHLSAFGWWRIRRIARRRGGLVIASHHAGMLPTLLRLSPGANLLSELIADLSGVAWRASLPASRESFGNPGSPGGSPSRGSSRVDASVLYEKHNGNLREALAEMYDVYAARP